MVDLWFGILVVGHGLGFGSRRVLRCSRCCDFVVGLRVVFLGLLILGGWCGMVSAFLFGLGLARVCVLRFGCLVVPLV